MSRHPDLTELLKDWEYDEENNVRFFQGKNGRDLMQIRQPLGIEQYNLDGRPDGITPEGEESWLDYYLRKENDAELSGGALILDDADFSRLQNEGVLYYYRYLALFQVGQYSRVARDTGHNLSIAALLERRYQGGSRNELLQYRPYIRRMNAISKAMLLLSENQTDQALEELEKGRREIEELSPVPTPVFEFEKIRSLQHLSQVISQVREAGDVDPSHEGNGFRDRLNEELNLAVEAEDYERAALLRDRLRRLD